MLRRDAQARELVKARVFASRFEAEIAVVEYLGWLNHTRLHGELGDVPPAEFEALWSLEPSLYATGAPHHLALTAA